MYSITKHIYFCYGHRLMKHAGKCRHLHGHSARAEITLRSKSLDQQAMVMDFSELKNIVGNYIDQQLDHNLLLHRNDPLCEILKKQGERFLALTEHPTAEYLAQMIFEYCQRQSLPVYKVVLWETESANASYMENQSDSIPNM
ncbi:MAG TPA: 6-carboxytetrahydropterin synthase [Crenotrichaceae bacterium]|nr:6-carboxytetrahydropterin synthase [Crenotrichaceae bacterium]